MSVSPLRIVSLLMVVALTTMPANVLHAQNDTTPTKPAVVAGAADNPFPNRVVAPAGMLDGGSEWMNTAKPLTLKDLKGKVVLVDFWTYCCINCIHILPDLEHLEKKYGNELVVIGCHSAKFDNEKVSANIREAVMRYEIKHPVVNDSEMTIWRKFGTRSWPTVAVIDPEGYYIGSQSGEGNRELLDNVISKLIAHHKAKGTLNETPLKFDLEIDKADQTPLRYPGKILADAPGNRLFISDSNHNRIVITSLDGKLKQTIGSGRLGLQDGDFETATFDHPQGMSLIGNKLYVADTENHAIRIADLTTKKVSTLAGTGEQSRVRIPRGKTESIALNSPWALQHHNGTLYIAMAGPHQLWSYKLGSDSIGVYAGSGREDIINGPLVEAALAQPSGIATDGTNLFVVDSEGSSIRRIGTSAGARVDTIAGTSNLPRGQSLFAFGDVDGIGAEARLQHPLGIAYRNNVLYVADSYNHKIKSVDLTSNVTSTWLGNGKAGDSLSPAQLSEPAGLTEANGKLYIADTNNHRICVADIETRAFSVLEIEGLTAPESTSAESSKSNIDRKKKSISLASHTHAIGKPVAIQLKLAYPEGYKINPLAPVIWQIFPKENETLINVADAEGRQEAEVAGETATFSIPLNATPGKTEIEFDVSWEFCKKGNESVCKRQSQRFRLPLELTAGGSSSPVVITTTVPSG